MAEKVGAVITGGDFQGLGVLRTLARKDIPIVVLDSDHCIGKFSRFKKKFFWAPLFSEEDTYVNFLVDLAKSEKLHGWVVYPNSDEAVYVLSKNKERLQEFYRIPTPSWDVIKYIYFKKNTYQLAEKNGIPIPKTYYANSLEELLDSDLQYPLVLKPSVRDHFYSKTKIKGYRINNEEEMINVYNYVRTIIVPEEILVQELIPGVPKNLYSFCPFFKEGKILTSIMARRARQHPMDFGHASTYAELVDFPEMRELAEKFLRLIGYYGIGEVEFMQDPCDRVFKLIEVNARVWGWHTIAIAAGIDLPYLLYQDMIGQPIEIPENVRNVKWVRLTTDLPTVFGEIVKGKMKIKEYLASMKGEKTFAVFAKDDPLPFFAEIAMIPYLWVKRGF